MCMCIYVCVWASVHVPAWCHFYVTWGQGGIWKGFRDAEQSWGCYTKAERPWGEKGDWVPLRA